MAAKTAALAGYWRKLSGRERVLASLVLASVLSLLLYQFGFVVQERSIRSLRAGIAGAEKDILDLTSRLADLKARQSEGKGVSAGWKLADKKSVILVLEDVSGEARRVGVNLVAVHPTQEIDRDSYKEVALNLDLKGRYRELAEYFKRLENLPQVVNIRKVRLDSCPDTASVCAAQVEAVTYLSK